MTATTGAAEHPDVSELSDLTEGLLPPSRTSDVRDHVAGCELCADVLDSLTEIRDLLGTLPGPPQMPADVAGRIDAALAAEALLDATRPGGKGVDVAAALATESSVPSDEAAESTESAPERHVSRETASGPVATGAVPASSSASASSAESAGAPDRPAGRPRAATGPGRRPSAPRRRRRNVAGAVLGAVATVAAIGLGTLMLQSGNNSADSGQNSASDTAGVQTFSGGTLDDQVSSLLAQDKRKEKSAAPDGSTPSFSTESSPESTDGDTRRTPKTNAPMRGEGPHVPQCIALGIDEDAPPLAAKKGTYDGKAAYLVVLPDSADSSRVTAYVVDASCVEENTGGKGEVLVSHSYPRS
ncbi:anti-sigma factor [Streptomyces cavernicola]|uniref:Zinc-finger domain-containing protein n=1 Tax=Streptomyces cavernicola TaxID=3043613 RepID=A0ABT6S608_9ACTN|nr:hypothetical protein [Streptomyces sp. B-S-A6]MDI3402761.1 hypothetical protein [Streptomyces sp. B-S-A6]